MSETFTEIAIIKLTKNEKAIVPDYRSQFASWFDIASATQANTFYSLKLPPT